MPRTKIIKKDIHQLKTHLIC